MKKEYKFIAVGILALLAVTFFLMKDSYLFPWEKDWKIVSCGLEGYKHPNGTVSVLDYGYRFVSIQERGEPPICYCELDTEPQNKDCIKHDDYLDIVEENSE